MNLKIAIAGTRGIPNHYGGFEQISTFLAEGLVQKGHEVVVYSSHNHPYKEKTFKGVEIRRCYDPEYMFGTAGQFIYDLNCIIDARKQNYDVLVFMGYTSSSVWAKLFPGNSVIISNMDGFEWKRAKYSIPVQKFLRYAEKLAVRNSHFHIADSKPMQDYLAKNYKVTSCFIPYGAAVMSDYSEQVLQQFGIAKHEYMLAIARMEPENNLEMILKGYLASGSTKKMVIVGNTANSYGNYLKKKFGSQSILFTGGIFNGLSLETLRKSAALYFHGHSVGGTNPSLLEAMASGCLIAAHDNPFNKAVLGEDAYYFNSAASVFKIIQQFSLEPGTELFKGRNYQKIAGQYNWQRIIDDYESFILSSFQTKKN